MASIHVLAGTNGAGKSSIGGAVIRDAGGVYFNPDEAARAILAADPALTSHEANSRAWLEGKRLLERAIDERGNFVFETTLGGQTITGLLQKAIAAGIDVRIWYVALSSPELHIARVRSRVEKGGHDIPEADIRKRYDASRLNLIALLAGLKAVRVYDNSGEADPSTGAPPVPRLLLHMVDARVLSRCALGATPDWAKPILAAARALDPNGF